MRVVITGGDGYGKSSLIGELKRRGYKTGDEVARKIIVGAGRPVHKEDRLGFQRRVLEEKIKQFKEAEGLVFFDRGIPDSTAYLIFGGVEPTEEFIEANHVYRYDLVFFVEKLQQHEHDNIREDAEDAARIHRLLKKVYKENGYRIISLPPIGISKRADLVLRYLKNSILSL